MFNINAGYGQLQAIALHNVKPTAGKVFLVGDSNTVDIDRLRYLFGVDHDGKLRYFDDLEEALNSGAVVAERGDVILVAPGHAETVSAAGDITLDIADVSIVGLGLGTSRPKITFDTATTATISVSAANVTLENIVIEANFADIVAPFTLAAAANFKLVGCEVTQAAAAMNFLYVFDTNATNNAADGLSFINSKWVEADTATISLAKIDADLDNFSVVGSYVNLGVNTSDLPALAVVATGKDVTNVMIEDNDVIRLNDANPLLVTADTTTANTGIIKNNRVRHADTASELLITAGTNIGLFDNKASAVVDASGYLLPAADS